MPIQLMEQNYSANPRKSRAVGPDDASENLKALRVDLKLEEKKLQGTIAKLISFATLSGFAVTSVPLTNSVLVLSSTEWQSLVSNFPNEEKSFRADLHRAVRRALGILAAIQEEKALYKVRVSGEYLWKQHWNSLCYLELCASQILPEVEQQGNEAHFRGLSQKAEDVKELVRQLRQSRAEISELDPENIAEKIDSFKDDPRGHEDSLQSVISQLMLFARKADEPVATIPLSKFDMAISTSEWRALTLDYPETEKSFRADSNRILRRAVGILAAIQQEMPLDQANLIEKSGGELHLSALFYLGHHAGQLLPDLKVLEGVAQQRGLIAMAEHIQAITARIQQHVNHISKLNHEWRGKRIGK